MAIADNFQGQPWSTFWKREGCFQKDVWLLPGGRGRKVANLEIKVFRIALNPVKDEDRGGEGAEAGDREEELEDGGGGPLGARHRERHKMDCQPDH